MVTAEPVFRTTIVFGLAAATALMSWFSWLGRSMLVRSEPSDSKSLAKTTASSDDLAVSTACVIGSSPGGCQPRLTREAPPSW